MMFIVPLDKNEATNCLPFFHAQRQPEPALEKGGDQEPEAGILLSIHSFNDAVRQERMK